MNSKAEDLLEELSPTMLVPRLMAMQDQRLSQEDYRRRVFDGHKMGLAALGFAPTPMTEEKEMGDINAGNQYHYYGQAAVGVQSNGAPQDQEPAVPVAPPNRLNAKDLAKIILKEVDKKIAKSQPPAPVPTDWKQYLWPAIAVLGTAGGFGTAIYNSQPDPPPVVATDADTDTTYKFEISSDKGSGFKAQ